VERAVFQVVGRPDEKEGFLICQLRHK
jgi:hypothetical protein